MRKLKKFVLSTNVSCLTNLEQLNIIGGSSSSNSCSNKPKDQCSGSCYDGGIPGYCGWTSKWNRCTCATTYSG